jgi:hypothetical protein
MTAPAIAFNQIITPVTARGPSFCRDTRPKRQGALCSTQTFLTTRCSQLAIVAMGKSKNKQAAKPESRPKSDKPTVKVSQKAFDPTLASLFASSVRLILLDSTHSSMLTKCPGRASTSSSKVTLPGPCAKRE